MVVHHSHGDAIRGPFQAEYCRRSCDDSKALARRPLRRHSRRRLPDLSRHDVTCLAVPRRRAFHHHLDCVVGSESARGHDSSGGGGFGAFLVYLDHGPLHHLGQRRARWEAPKAAAAGTPVDLTHINPFVQLQKTAEQLTPIEVFKPDLHSAVHRQAATMTTARAAPDDSASGVDLAGTTRRQRDRNGAAARRHARRGVRRYPPSELTKEATSTGHLRNRLARTGRANGSPPDRLAVLAVVRPGTVVAAAASPRCPHIRAGYHHDRLETPDD